MIITLFSNSSWSLFNFRKDLIEKMIRQKHEVIVISNKDETSKKLIKLGCKFIAINFNTISKNPFKEALCILKIFFLIFKSKSDLFINFTIKPCIYFGLINLLLNKKSISMLDGLGRSFIDNNFFSQVMIKLLKFSQIKTKKIILVNKDDINFFKKNKIVKNIKKIELLRAPGLEVNNYQYKKRIISKNKKLTFSFISRVIEEKGIIYFLKSAEIIKKKFNADFFVMGSIEKKNIQHLIKKFTKKKIIKYYKNQNNIKQKLLDSDCIILPSYYREGLPRILQEANYFGRICIAFNNVGSKDIIINNFNGFLCKKKSLNSLLYTIKKVIQINRNKLSFMETNAHYYIKKNFNKDKINFKFLKIVNHVSKI
jgi:glycosyltransferase involved in cell wall biosynthesis